MYSTKPDVAPQPIVICWNAVAERMIPADASTYSMRIV